MIKRIRIATRLLEEASKVGDFGLHRSQNEKVAKWKSRNSSSTRLDCRIELRKHLCVVANVACGTKKSSDIFQRMHIYLHNFDIWWQILKRKKNINLMFNARANESLLEIKGATALRSIIFFGCRFFSRPMKDLSLLCPTKPNFQFFIPKKVVFIFLLWGRIKIYNIGRFRYESFDCNRI